MKAGIHPDYVVAKVRCSCGNEFTTRATKADLHVELCSECHPFYTGKQKLVDTGGRIDRFERRYGKRSKEHRSELRRPGRAPTGDILTRRRTPRRAARRQAQRPRGRPLGAGRSGQPHAGNGGGPDRLRVRT